MTPLKHNLLLTPGPTPVPPEVLRVMAEPIFHHRTPRYRAFFREASEDLKTVFRTKQAVYTFTGSGTLGMEASVANFLSPGDSVLVVRAGKFGERWEAIAKRCPLNVLTLEAPYGDVVAPGQVEAALKSNPHVKAVFGTHCETSTGVLFDVQGIARAAANTSAIFVVDAISSLAADRLEMDDWQIDVVVSGSQKGLMTPPGLAFLAASEKAKRLMSGAQCPRYYLDLEGYEKSLQDWDTPFTSALTLVLGLREALILIKKEGMERIWNRTAELAQMTRRRVQEIGLELFAKKPANTLTAVKVPPGVDGEKLVSIMRDELGVTMAGGQGGMKGKVIRIAHLGYITAQDIETGISVLAETLTERKRSVTHAGEKR